MAKATVSIGERDNNRLCRLTGQTLTITEASVEARSKHLRGRRTDEPHLREFEPQVPVAARKKCNLNVNMILRERPVAAGSEYAVAPREFSEAVVRGTMWKNPIIRFRQS